MEDDLKMLVTRVFTEAERRERDDVMRATAAHIRRVGELMVEASSELARRAVQHDRSKWSSEEWEDFARETPGLRSLTYNSPEYKAALARLGPALKQHYACNAHHPEFHRDGVNDMTLLDLTEMLCDWKAATERHADGDIERSIVQNTERFKLEPQTVAILRNTAVAMGFISPKTSTTGSSC